MKQWEISVSTRLKAELLKLKLQRKSDDADERVFASASVNLRKVWEAARKEAGISSMRFHDLRHHVCNSHGRRWYGDAGTSKDFGPH